MLVSFVVTPIALGFSPYLVVNFLSQMAPIKMVSSCCAASRLLLLFTQLTL